MKQLTFDIVPYTEKFLEIEIVNDTWLVGCAKIRTCVKQLWFDWFAVFKPDLIGSKRTKARALRAKRNENQFELLIFCSVVEIDY